MASTIPVLQVFVLMRTTYDYSRIISIYGYGFYVY